MPPQITRSGWLIGLAAAGAIVALIVVWSRTGRAISSRALGADAAGEAPSLDARPRVAVVRPDRAGFGRSTTQPGTVESFDYADLYAKVSGYLERQTVDIGDKVKTGQVLAELKNPELTQELNQAIAQLAQARAQVQQMEAAIVTAKAVRDAAAAAVRQSEAELIRETASLAFRKKQYDRIKSLFELKSVDERLVDEKQDQLDAALAAQNAAKAAILTANAQEAAAKAKIAQAEANLVDSRAKVQVATATVDKAKVFVDYTKIVSPYDGVVTKRSFHVGDLIRAADHGGQLPMFIVARTDRVRVVVQIPEQEVPFLDPGDSAVVELDALAGHKFTAKVARIANAEDRVTRSMRAEIDLPNTSNEFRDGMFGRVTIQLSKASDGLTVPSRSVFTDAKKRTAVYVVRAGRTQARPVEVGRDDGVQAEIVSGLRADDLVIRRPTDHLSDGAAVDIEAPESVAATAPTSR